MTLPCFSAKNQGLFVTGSYLIQKQLCVLSVSAVYELIKLEKIAK